jgi:hypothetical protein
VIENHNKKKACKALQTLILLSEFDTNAYAGNKFGGGNQIRTGE